MDEETDRSGPGGTADVVCALCGARAASENAPPTWLCSVENGSRHYFCDDCARTHIRAIEGRLDSAWW
ncbi:hypothetical protein OG345_13080 [Streptomyces sp. NBC_01220]|uniref:hypothetical protein n=1 Tax=unclassified Streptomyces TaxID=2593676 RepID=UPI002E2CC11F|nr:MULTISPECIES: hypothetical protein [unclassified Streptomyces]WSQ43865.1 hypothetical protein OG345_13080 [Streptomyces sp. NBC_01220]